MNRLALALVALFALGASAGAQVITNPNIADPIGCAYNTTPPTLTNGQAGWVQCDPSGALRISTGVSGGTTPVSCSGTITTGGTAQNAVTASATRRGLQIMNIDTTEGMWIRFNGTATAGTEDSYFLAPATSTTAGGSYVTPSNFGFNTALSVVAATTGHKFSCTQW